MQGVSRREKKATHSRAGGGTVARAQTVPNVKYEGENVTAIDLASRPEADVEYFRDLITQQTGQPYSNAKIQESIAALMATGEFSSARVEVSPANGGLRLVFVLEPAYYLGLVVFPGAVPPFSYTRLLQVVTFSEGAPFLRRQINDATRAMQTFLARSGYFAAKVNPRTETDSEHKLVNPIFEVTLNRRAKIGTIDFEGLSEAGLRRFLSRTSRNSQAPPRPFQELFRPTWRFTGRSTIRRVRAPFNCKTPRSGESRFAV